MNNTWCEMVWNCDLRPRPISVFPISTSDTGTCKHQNLIRDSHFNVCTETIIIIITTNWLAWYKCKLHFKKTFIIIINNRGLNARWCLMPLLLSLPTAAYLGKRGLTPARLPHTTAQCHLTILGEAILFCLNHPSFRTPGSLSFCCRSFCRYGWRGATFSVSLSAVEFLPIESFCTILH